MNVPGFQGQQNFRFGEEGGGQQRQRVSIACVYCRQRKIKCNGGQTCNNCLQQGKECTYRGVLPDEAMAVRLKKAQQKARRQARSSGHIPADPRAMTVYPPYDERYNPYLQTGTFPNTPGAGRSRSSGGGSSLHNVYGPVMNQQAAQAGNTVGFQGPSTLGSSYYHPQAAPSYLPHGAYSAVKGAQSSSFTGSGPSSMSSQGFHPFSGSSQSQGQQAYSTQLGSYLPAQPVPFHSPSATPSGLAGQHLQSDVNAGYGSGLSTNPSGSYIPYQSGAMTISGLPGLRQEYGSGSEQEVNRPMLPPLAQSQTSTTDTTFNPSAQHSSSTSNYIDANFTQGAGSDFGLQPGVARHQSLSVSPQPNQSHGIISTQSHTPSSVSSAEPRDTLHPTDLSVIIRDNGMTNARPYSSFERTNSNMGDPLHDAGDKMQKHDSDQIRLLSMNEIYNNMPENRSLNM